MGSYDYLLLAGIVIALAMGAFQVPRLLSYIAFAIIGAIPVYNLAGKYDINVLSGTLMVAVFVAIYAGLYWIGSRYSGKRAA